MNVTADEVYELLLREGVLEERTVLGEMSKRASQAGKEYEIFVGNNMLSWFPDDIEKADFAGSGIGSDVTLTLKDADRPLSIETKTSAGADFPQFKFHYDLQHKKWKPTLTPNFLKNEILFSGLFEEVVEPYLQSSAYFTEEDIEDPKLNVKSGNVVGLRACVGTCDLRKKLQQRWFEGRESVRLQSDTDIISQYYAAKGDEFIQIKGKGVYSTTRVGAKKYGILYFGDAGPSYVRVRVKTHGTADGAHSFTVALQVPSGAFKKSSLNLDNRQDATKLFQVFMSADPDEVEIVGDVEGSPEQMELPL